MSLIVDLEKNEKIVVDSNKMKLKVPHLKTVNGSVQIDDRNPLEKKWFEEFKK